MGAVILERKLVGVYKTIGALDNYDFKSEGLRHVT